MLPDFDVAGQEALLQSKVLVVGMGGLGCPVAMYLAASGVGELHLADDDIVDLSNLQRQIAHTVADIGSAKVESVKNTIAALNPAVAIQSYPTRLAGEELNAAVAAVDLVIDASDNFSTRFAINLACLKNKVPLVSGAAIRAEGQVAVFDPQKPESPCYRCLYSDVLAPLVGIVGSIQAIEALKCLANYGETLTGRLLLIDAKYMSLRELQLPKDPLCPACGVGGS